MKKKILTVLLFAVTCFCVFSLVGCLNNNSSEEKTLTPTDGLQYILLDNNTYAVGIGMATYAEDIIIPAQYNGKIVSALAESAFSGVTGIKTVHLPDTIKIISNNSFFGCTSLESINIPASVTNLGKNTFQGCTKLTKIELSENIVSIGSKAFANCKSLETVIMGEKIISIGSSAFLRCSNLASITLPNSLQTILHSAFAESGLTSINIPPNVNYIEENAFSSSYLTSATFENKNGWVLHKNINDNILWREDISIKNTDLDSSTYCADLLKSVKKECLLMCNI